MALKFKMERNFSKGKMSIGKKLIAILMITGLGFSSASAQRTLEIGGFGGGSYYIGDINPALHFYGTKPAYGALARLNLNPRIAMRLSWSRGKVTGDDTKTKVVSNRNLSFLTIINDISFTGEFNFWEYYTGSKRNYFTPYIMGGFSLFFYNPKSLSGADLRSLGTEGQNVGFDGRKPYKKWSLAFTFGFGFKYSLTEKLGLGFEWGMRKAFTDYIDDVSTTYYIDGSTIDPDNTAQILSDPTMSHKPYVQRGNDKNFDWYNFTGISITYKCDLIGRKKCNTTKW